MIVDRDIARASGRSPTSCCAAFAGHDAATSQRGSLGWSNELVRHVVEIKNIAPDARRSTRCPSVSRTRYSDANRLLGR